MIFRSNLIILLFVFSLSFLFNFVFFFALPPKMCRRWRAGESPQETGTFRSVYRMVGQRSGQMCYQGIWVAQEIVPIHHQPPLWKGLYLMNTIFRFRAHFSQNLVLGTSDFNIKMQGASITQNTGWLVAISLNNKMKPLTDVLALYDREFCKGASESFYFLCFPRTFPVTIALLNQWIDLFSSGPVRNGHEWGNP